MSRPVALVTGAARGIGRGIALELARHGYDIAALATRLEPGNLTKGLFEVKARVEELGGRCEPIAGDLGDLAQHERMVDAALSALGGIDVLVNNAGVAPLVRLDILETTPESYDRAIGINARGPFFFTQRVANQMLRQPAGPARCIVFITSISASTASPNRAEYCVSKAALSMTAMNFAVRLAEAGINVYEVRPGIIATDMTAGVQEKYDRFFEGKPILQNRWGTPEDVGRAVAALAEGYFPYSTGSIIEVGGGFSVSKL